MGVALVTAAVTIEIAFALVRILRKSTLDRAGGFLRLTELAAFALLAALGVIDWSSRYYALAALLLALAAAGLVKIARQKVDSRPFKTGRVIGRAAGMSALLFAVIFPAILFPQHDPIPPTGPYPVATALYTFTDPSRVETYASTGENRKVNVEFWYPRVESGRYPLVVFSHGGNGIKTSNETMFNELASRGYVVASIDHPYHSLFTTGTDGRTTLIDPGYMQELTQTGTGSDPEKSFALFQKWMKIRTGDINFTIDQILKEAKNPGAEPVYRFVDTAKIGVMGHSLGGAAALGTGRLRADVSAVIALDSPFLCDITGVKDGGYVFVDAPYPAPLLNIYSDDVWNHLSEWNQYPENLSLVSNPPADVFNVHIRGTGHLSLTDLSLSSPMLASAINEQKSTVDSRAVLQRINRLALEFFDAYLKGTGSFTSAGEY